MLGIALFATGSYFLYRAATPLIEDARNYVRGLSELGKLEAEVKNKAPHAAPASGELSEAQVQRFARVQNHAAHGSGSAHAGLRAEVSTLDLERRPLAPIGARPFGGLRELAGVYVQARRYQVDALNKENFSQEEYSWVRNRMFEAAGMQVVANRIDLRSLERAIRDGTGIDDFETPDLPKPTSRPRTSSGQTALEGVRRVDTAGVLRALTRAAFAIERLAELRFDFVIGDSRLHSAIGITESIHKSPIT